MAERLLVIDIIPRLRAPEIGEEGLHVLEERATDTLLHIRPSLDRGDLDMDPRAGDVIRLAVRRVVLLQDAEFHALWKDVILLELRHEGGCERNDLLLGVAVFLHTALVLEVQINPNLTDGRRLLREEASLAIPEVRTVELEELVLVIVGDHPLLAILERPVAEGLVLVGDLPADLFPVRLSIRVSIQKEIQTSRHDTPLDNFSAAHPF